VTIAMTAIAMATPPRQKKHEVSFEPGVARRSTMNYSKSLYLTDSNTYGYTRFERVMKLLLPTATDQLG